MKRFAIQLVLFLAGVGAFAQTAAVSQISGSVQDASGLAVPGAQINVTQTGTRVTRTTQSGPDDA